MTSASTQPRDRAYWTTVIHNAASIPTDHPKYGEARQVIQMGIQGLQDIADSSAEKDIKDISPGKVGTALVNFGHGASLGLAGDPTYLELARQANPKTAFISDVAGTAALGGVASPLVAGLSPAMGGALIGGGLAAGRGAIEPLPGMSRGESAAIMGAGGAVTGALVSKFVSKLVPAVRTIYGNVARMLGRSATQEEISSVTENAIRAQLAKMKVQPDLIDRAVASWKASGTLSMKAPPAPEVPVTVRPGETITQTSPRGFEVNGTRATPPVPTTPTLAEMQGFRTEPLGKGPTLPWYPRGGSVEQGMAPPPASSPPPLAPNQNQAFIEFLKGATSPTEASARVGTLKALGVLGPQDEAALLQMLGVP